jgi:hypothetical protein
MADDPQWVAIGHLNGCQACSTAVPPFNTAVARYLWRRCSASSNCCTTRLCGRCCARWRAGVETGEWPAPYRISEIDPAPVLAAARDRGITAPWERS